MWAKELKKKNIEKQRHFIQEKINKVANENKDGDVSYIYHGIVYPEVREYFDKKGISISEIKNEALLAQNGGCPAFLCTIKDTIMLSEADLKEALFGKGISFEDEDSLTFNSFDLD